LQRFLPKFLFRGTESERFGTLHTCAGIIHVGIPGRITTETLASNIATDSALGNWWKEIRVVMPDRPFAALLRDHRYLTNDREGYFSNRQHRSGDLGLGDGFGATIVVSSSCLSSSRGSRFASRHRSILAKTERNPNPISFRSGAKSADTLAETDTSNRCFSELRTDLRRKNSPAGMPVS
jgi:hypothetical protein